MENAKQLRPIGQLFIATWDSYRMNFKKMMLLMLFGLIGIVPYAALFAISTIFPAPLAAYQSAIAIIMFVAYLFCLYWFISTWLGFLILIRNPEKKIMDVFNEGRKLVWGDLAIGMVSALFIGLWSLLFVVPGIIFMVFYSFAVFAFIYDGYRRSAALKRSRELVSGNWWPVFARLVIGIVIILAFGIIFGLIYNLSHSPLIYYIFEPIYYFITLFFFSPLFAIYLALTYKDLVEIKPDSKLPKEKNDYWLVVLATILVIIAVISIFALFALMMMASIGSEIPVSG
jgi:hypothetical protein